VNTVAKYFVFFFLFTFAIGCSKNPNDIINEWKENGWSYVSTHGSIGEVKRTGMLQSEKAQAVEAAWSENGKRKTKLYQQTSHYYVILRFFKADDEEFVVVMRKRK
jgi:hypothetical protein